MTNFRHARGEDFSTRRGNIRKVLLNLLRVGISLGLMVWAVSRAGLPSLLETLRGADLGLFLLGLALYQPSMLVRSARWRLLLREANLPFSVRHLLALTYVGAFFSTFLPTSYGGDVIRAAELQDEHAGAVSGGIVLLDRMLGLSALFSIGLVALVVSWQALPPGMPLPLVGLSVGTLMAIALVVQGSIPRRVSSLLPPPLSLKSESWLGRLYWTVTGCSKRALLAAWGLSLLNNVLVILMHYTVGRAVGVRVTLWTFAGFTPIVGLAMLLPTVQGLGAREEAYRILLTGVGVPARAAVATGLGVYGVSLLTGVIGGVYYVGRSVGALVGSQAQGGNVSLAEPDDGAEA